MTACEDKVEYPSEYVAGNAAELHRMSFPDCEEIHHYLCPGSEPPHWHIGHPTHAIGEHCKAHSSTWRGGYRRRPDTSAVAQGAL